MSMDSARNGLTRRQLGGLILATPLAAASWRDIAAAPVVPKALFYDVFGTVMDWRTGVARESERILSARGHKLDWLKFADAWRALYQASMEEVRSGRRPFVKLDVLHREMLEKIRPQFGLTDLSEDTLADLNLAWHRIDAWPDVRDGFARLGRRFLMAPCSNGNIALMADLARRNAIRWDAILGSDIAHDYKPKPGVYLAAADAFNLKPSECMMVAAHSADLGSAAAVGLHTAHVARPNEYGPNTGEAGPKVPVDYSARSMMDLADKLGA
jgi:2-haloacid dehalogenase